MKPFKALWRVVRGLLLALAAVVLFLEEWGWRPLTAWARAVRARARPHRSNICPGSQSAISGASVSRPAKPIIRNQ